MTQKSKLSKILNAIAKEYENEEDENDIDAVFITVANEDNSLRIIPYDCETKSFNNSWKTLGYLSQGILTISSMIGIASELTYVKSFDEKEFNRLYALVSDKLDDDELIQVNKMIEDMLEMEKKWSEEDELLSKHSNKENLYS